MELWLDILDPHDGGHGGLDEALEAALLLHLHLPLPTQLLHQAPYLGTPVVESTIEMIIYDYSG